MGTTFTHFNPLSDENGLGLQDRFNTKIGHIGEESKDVCYIFVSDDNKCHKYKINDTSDPQWMKDYTPLKLFKYIFGNAFKHYIDHPSYKNMSEEELLKICDDFAQHLKTSGKVIIKDAADVERERFSIKYPDNAYAKYADPNKIWFSRIIDADTKETLYFYFPIQLEEDEKRYHVIIKHHEFRNIQLAYFDPFNIDLQSSANAILQSSEKQKLCILHIIQNKITIEFCEDNISFVFTPSTPQFYKMLFSKIYKDYIADEVYKKMTDDELSKICTDFEAYLEYFKTNEIVQEETNKKKYRFHVMFPENMFARSIVNSQLDKTTYMCKIMNERTNKIKYHYLPLEIISNNIIYNVMVDYNEGGLQLNPLIKGESETS
jgi:hypothetical protein